MADGERLSHVRKVVNQGIFHAELHEFLRRELADCGYSSVDITRNSKKTVIVVHASKVREIRGTDNLRVKQIQACIEQHFGFSSDSVDVYFEALADRGLCAAAQCESLRYKLEMGLPVRRAAYAIIRFVMGSGAVGVEISVSGKLHGQRAKTQKYRDGYLVTTGMPGKEFVDHATQHIKMRQGIIGIQVKIFRPPTAEHPLPDHIVILEPKEEAPIQAMPMVPPQRPMEPVPNN